MPCNLSPLSVAQDSVTASLYPHHKCVLLCGDTWPVRDLQPEILIHKQVSKIVCNTVELKCSDAKFLCVSVMLGQKYNHTYIHFFANQYMIKSVWDGGSNK